ncbi:MAG TPA: hypothetical protein VK569_05990, partial [Bacteroidota bacterium]|nr:hypothetical protein [Bacteroidota bacterium]
MSRRFLSQVCLFLFIATGSLAQDMNKGHAQGGPVTVVISHRVREYYSWRRVFDADEHNRKNAGFKVWGVYLDPKDPGMVVIIGTCPSAAAAESFMSSSTLKDAMTRAGVTSKPEMKVLTTAP